MGSDRIPAGFRRRRARPKLLEAGVATIIPLCLSISFLLGGAEGLLGRFLFLVCALLLLGAAVFAAWLTFRLQLSPSQKAGVLLMIAGGVGGVGCFAFSSHEWRRTSARVVSVDAPVEGEVRCWFSLPGSKDSPVVEVTMQWPAAAKVDVPPRFNLFVNPLNPSDVSLTARPSMLAVKATRMAGPLGLRPARIPSAVLQAGSIFRPFQVTISGDAVSGLRPGASVDVWQNPRNSQEVSLEPRTNPVAWQFIAACGVAGMVFLSGAGVAFMTRGAWRMSAGTGSDSLVDRLLRREPLGAGERGTDYDLSAIDWYQFEKVCERLLISDGWTVARLGGARPDGGADLLARKDGRTAVVQCKFWRNTQVMPSVVRELLGCKVSAQFSADHAMLFSLSECTASAQEFARNNGVEVFGRPAIEAWIARIGPGKFPELMDPDNKRCPRCDSAMALREARGGPFWGCVCYPRCTGTIECIPPTEGGVS